jgi:hypothetical protein
VQLDEVAVRLDGRRADARGTRRQPLVEQVPLQGLAARLDVRPAVDGAQRLGEPALGLALGVEPREPLLLALAALVYAHVEHDVVALALLGYMTTHFSALRPTAATIAALRQ